MSNTFVLYDGRAKLGDPYEASVLDVAQSEESAKQSGRENWRNYDAIWYEYEEVIVDEVLANKHPGLEVGKPMLTNGKERWDIPPATDLEKKHNRLAHV